MACFLSGSDTASNVLFGNLQVAAAHQLHLSPVLMAATNSSGAVAGKMISPQNNRRWRDDGGIDRAGRESAAVVILEQRRLCDAGRCARLRTSLLVHLDGAVEAGHFPLGNCKLAFPAICGSAGFSPSRSVQWITLS